MDKKTVWDLGRDDLSRYRSREKLPLVMVLDNVRSLNNIGAIFRTCDAFRVSRLMLCGISACPPSPEIHKTALGAENSVEWRHYDDTLDCLADLRAEGYTLACLEQVKGSVELQDFGVNRSGRYAVIAGNEVDGVSPGVVDACDAWIEIPQEGTKHSLNVSVSAGIALWHFFTGLRS